MDVGICRIDCESIGSGGFAIVDVVRDSDSKQQVISRRLIEQQSCGWRGTGNENVS
ncbi:hypothetical protein RBSWK_03355 [Rhodopirellula baltica SWK14]|uniref:Uncharacterized protein n=1 Tax=Rhodopirellula baltica SWK14 TaxID=993516 RepID=L7CFT5_RHOBT|nr:hypothetical protein RBSWK_03355 [Rhodopirellula baltica SWK14]